MRTKRDALTALTFLVGTPFLMDANPTRVAVGLALYGVGVYAGVDSLHRRVSRLLS